MTSPKRLVDDAYNPADSPATNCARMIKSMLQQTRDTGFVTDDELVDAMMITYSAMLGATYPDAGAALDAHLGRLRAHVLEGIALRTQAGRTS